MVDRLLFDMLNMLHQRLWHAFDGDPVGGCVQKVMTVSLYMDHVGGCRDRYVVSQHRDVHVVADVSWLTDCCLTC
jgi:hypothetical protein